MNRKIRSDNSRYQFCSSTALQSAVLGLRTFCCGKILLDTCRLRSALQISVLLYAIAPPPVRRNIAICGDTTINTVEEYI